MTLIHHQQPGVLVDPADVGMDPAGLERAHRLIEQRDAAAQLAVIRHGQLVDRRSFGCDADGLFWIFSTSKPYTAALVHLLADRGLFALDDPVATYWPEFGRYGKHAITIAHVLQHRTGFATTGTPLRDVLACTDWQRTVRAIERVRPRRPAGSPPAYQFLIFGFILGEVIQRVTGRPYAEVLRDELLDPFGLDDTHLGITAELAPRQVPVVFRHRGGTVAAGRINAFSTRQAILPSAGISTTAEQAARFYQQLLAARSGAASVISQEAIGYATTPTSNGEIDRFCKTPIPWSYGFQLGGDRGPGWVPPFGYRSSRRTFGHNGSNCCIAFADPDRDLAVAYLTNLRVRHTVDMAHLAAVNDEIFAACTD